MPIKLKTTFLIIIVAVVALAAILNLYAVSEGAGGFAIWNGSEVYFFVKVDRRGYYASFLEYPWILVKEYLSVSTPPRESRAFLVVIRVTSSGVERHMVKLAERANGGAGSDPSKYTPLNGQIYADCPPLDGLCRWAGDHFEKATEDERHTIAPERFGPKSRLTTADFDNDASGWSRRVFVAGPVDRTFAIEATGFRVLVHNIGVNSTDGKVSMELLRTGRPAERIAAFETREGHLGRAEYRRAFRDAE